MDNSFCVSICFCNFVRVGLPRRKESAGMNDNNQQFQ